MKSLLPMHFLNLQSILMNQKRLYKAWTLVMACCTAPAFAQVSLPRLVSDSMVLQRDTKLKIWGWASKNEKVTVRFGGRKISTNTGNDGKWAISLPAMKAGGPHEMTITASNSITLRNILIGDVWFCAGQSNMVHYLELHRDRYANDIAKANYPEIRQFVVPTTAQLQQPSENVTQGKWKPATGKDIMRFSVVAFFFARQLYEKYHVPIGIINASVGGTPIEAWTSEEGLKEFPEIANSIQQNKDTAYTNQFLRHAQATARINAARKIEDEGLIGSTKWFDTVYIPKNWHTINIPGYWEDQGIKDLDGVVWYRQEFDVPLSMIGFPAKVELGRIVDADFLYVNGKLVGNTTYLYPQRRYQLPAGVLKRGKNIFVIRVLNNGGKGGFVPDKPYRLTANGDTIDLKGYWQYKVGEVYAKAGNSVPQFSAQNQPASLYNGMVAPVTNYAVKGFLWYQGESNTGRAEEYKRLLPTLIGDWRQKWNQGDLPFLFVQLPNFMDVNYSPSESQWATLREAQLQTLRVPNTAMAVAIDLGEWNDIHPGNKKPIGERLALAAQHMAYSDDDVVYSGPIYESAKTEGNKIIVTFTHIGSGLISKDDEALNQFAIAGRDKKFVWAKARIENNTVVVWGDDVVEPAYVRYAWADNPDGANLYNREGLPASPFRTDE
jgi:sialate O-acetylesterase